jgi:mono/diheme cytochrome c family protein
LHIVAFERFSQFPIKEAAMKMKTIASITFALTFVIAFCWLPLSGQAQGDPFAAKGRKLFGQYCVSCHGNDGKGHGPVASSLKVAPTDLTAIQKQGEKFPFIKVMIAIDGEKTDRAIDAHGTSAMPVWGAVLRRKGGDLEKQSSVYALAKYIESIQGVR